MGAVIPLALLLFVTIKLLWRAKKFLTLENGSKGLKTAAEKKRNKEGGDRIEYGCFGWLKTEIFGSISLSFSIDLLKTSKLKM